MKGNGVQNVYHLLCTDFFYFISLFQYVLYVFLSHTHSHPDLKETQDIPQINFTRHYIRGPFRS